MEATPLYDAADKSLSSSAGPEAQDMCELTNQLLRSEGECFKQTCVVLKQRVRNKDNCDASILANALVGAMRLHFFQRCGTPCCKHLVELLEEFCLARMYLRTLPVDTLRTLLKEQLRNLSPANWTKNIENGTAILKTLNVSCVILLTGISKAHAYGLLLEVGTNESETVSGWLVLKCLKKVD